MTQIEWLAGRGYNVLGVSFPAAFAGAWHCTAAWEDMPTQYNIVNAFAALPIVEYRDASVTQSVGAKDLSDQRMLR